MDVRSLLASQSYLAQRKTQPAADAQSAATGALADFSKMVARAEDTAQSAALGKADPHALVQALAETQLAVETAVTVRDRVVEAYQEILRMPV
ncbi:MAG: flagellar hook-basal body complex protein FliE [Rhodobacteraceae bacterium]|nr:flagellar hook-basal body complex protein FliE [Paracoccaceae bacterium]